MNPTAAVTTKRIQIRPWLVVTGVLVATSFVSPRRASGEVVLVDKDSWQVFTDGRMGGFLSYLNGNGYPSTQLNAEGNAIQTPFGGGINVNAANPIATPVPAGQTPSQPRLESMRVRSGFLGNILAVGVRNRISEWTTVTGYVQLWADIESESRRKYVPMPVDVRQGFMKVEGRWGSLIVGRQLTLFSRGAAEIDFLYGHGYGVGFPTNVDTSGTAAGHVGTGVLGPGFAGGMVYATPSLGGLVLSVAVFDPVALQGAWDRTKFARPEGELTYDLAFGSRNKLKLFVNGGYQKTYRIGEPDSTSAAAYGVGYGGRIEVGPVHLGAAGHWGQGLGLFYALETTEAAYDASALHRLRKSDGYYLQAQLALGRFDFNAGTGIARVTPLRAATATINGETIMIPADGDADINGNRQSLIKYQWGTSAAIVYHASPSLHFDLDWFHGDFRWQLGEFQVVNFVNAGATMTW